MATLSLAVGSAPATSDNAGLETPVSEVATAASLPETGAPWLALVFAVALIALRGRSSR